MTRYYTCCFMICEKKCCFMLLLKAIFVMIFAKISDDIWDKDVGYSRENFSETALK